MWGVWVESWGAPYTYCLKQREDTLWETERERERERETEGDRELQRKETGESGAQMPKKRKIPDGGSRQ